MYVDVSSASYFPIFQEQNMFMYDIFLTIIQTPMGIHFVCAHYGMRDDGAILKDLTSYMHTSTTANILSKTFHEANHIIQRKISPIYS